VQASAVASAARRKKNEEATYFRVEINVLNDSIGAVAASNVSNGRFLDQFIGTGGPAQMLFKSIQQTKRFLKILFGFTLLALGVVMLVTPGPGWLVIALGLGVLAAEFVWARRLLDSLKEQGGRLKIRVYGFATRFFPASGADRI
jgi:hypothetical protein